MVSIHRVVRGTPQMGVVSRELLYGLRAWVDLTRARVSGNAPNILPLLYIELLRGCNLSCRHCGFASHYPVEGKILSRLELKAIMRDALTMKTRIVSFGGGEPFLRADIMDILQDANELGLAAHINTNATRITPTHIRRMADLNTLTLIVSLDHPDPDGNDAIRGNGVFAAVHNTVRQIRTHAPAVSLGINCVINKANLGHLTRMAELAADWGVQAVRFTPLHHNLNHGFKPEDKRDDLTLTPADADRLVVELQSTLTRCRQLGLRTNSASYLSHVPQFVDGKLGEACWAGYIYANIDPYGNLFPCYDHQTQLNVRAGGLLTAWRSPEMAVLRTRVRQCTNACWNTGNAEPSIRMNWRSLLRHPMQIIQDIDFFLP